MSWAELWQNAVVEWVIDWLLQLQSASIDAETRRMRWYLAECMHSSIDRTPLRWSLCVSPCLYVCVPCCVSLFLCLILLPAAYDCAVESHARRSPTNIVIVDAGRDVRRTVANRHDVTTGHRAGLTTAVDSSRRLRSRLDRPMNASN